MLEECYHELVYIYVCIYMCVRLKMSRLTAIMSQFSQFYTCLFSWKTDLSFLIYFIVYYNLQILQIEHWKEIIQKNLETSEKKKNLCFYE